MKKLISPLIWLVFVQLPGSYKKISSQPQHLTPSENLFIITLDGFRWQEVFRGADSILMNDGSVTPDSETTTLLYGGASAEERRKKLMPFFWNIIAVKGQLLGNRDAGSKLNITNDYALSYPGYSEMLTGNANPFISSNRKINNPDINVLEYLATRHGFTDKVVAFSSWDVFPFILNTERNRLKVNSGYLPLQDLASQTQKSINAVQQSIRSERPATRQDMLTYLSAREYIKEKHPRVVFLSLGETDEYAHEGRYDMYLQKASEADRMIGELWQWVQSTAYYRNNTTFLITTDHGRGSKSSKWQRHGEFIQGSSQVWMALIGPGIAAEGEIKKKQQHYLAQVAQTISLLVGENFPETGVAPALALTPAK